MSLSTLAIGLVISVLGTLVAGLLALIPHAYAHKASNIVLALSAFVGAVVGVTLATGNGVTLALPEALYPVAADGATHTWPLFYNMVFGLDRFSAIFYSIVSVVTVFVAIYAIPYLEQQAHHYNIRSVNVLTALFVFGLQGVILSTNIIGFMTFWEIMSIVSFFLVLADGSIASRKAAFLYLIMTHLGAGAIMAGFFLLSGGALLSDFSVLAVVTGQLSQTTFYVALGLLLIGFGSKSGLVPFHVWLPEAYGETPFSALALMAGAGITIPLYGFLRVLLFMVPGVPLWFSLTVLTLGALSAVVGVLYAVVERDMKRLLAYSSIENMGLIFAMIGVALLAGQEGSADLTQAALYAALFLALAHALFKSGLFLAAGVAISASRSRRLEDMGGLARRMPRFSAAVCVLALTAASMPPFGPFIAEWTFLQSIVGALQSASPTLTVALVVMLALIGFVAGMALFAMVKMYAIGFLAEPRSDAARNAIEPGLLTVVPIVLLAFGGLLLGLFAPFVYHHIGAVDMAVLDTGAQQIITGGGALAPLSIFVLMFSIVGVLALLRQVFTDVKHERVYQTWDCGQPITPRMEYTATAFSAPIRFFFRFFLRTQKAVITTPIVATNPWIASKSMTLTVRQVWYDRMYVPAGHLLTKFAKFVGRLQNGSIQFYIGLILGALFVTLIIAL
ncbi:MAG: Proton antipo protein [Patescibacteria group bacterium]|nr:Proton antipo protein [Patescibacteria group bacterium]